MTISALEIQFRRFVEQNPGIGFGRMMQIVSEVWHEKHGDSAHLANETYAGLKKKKQKCKRAGHDWSEGSEVLWCDRCGANKKK